MIKAVRVRVLLKYRCAVGEDEEESSGRLGRPCRESRYLYHASYLLSPDLTIRILEVGK